MPEQLGKQSASAMPKLKLTEYLRIPTHEQLREVRSLRFLEHLLFEPNLWHFNRRSVSWSCFIGLFCAFLPMPMQMVPAALLAVWIRSNVPLAISLVWVTNPFTMPPVFYFTYRMGGWMLGEPQQSTPVSMSVEWLEAQFAMIWEPLLLGSISCGIVVGLTAFFTVRLYWRWKVKRDWKSRRLNRSLAAQNGAGHS